MRKPTKTATKLEALIRVEMEAAAILAKLKVGLSAAINCDISGSKSHLMERVK